MLKAPLVWLIAFSAVNGLILFFGFLQGVVIHWIVRSVDLGTGMLIGVITTGFSIHYFVRLMRVASSFPSLPPDAEEGEFVPPSFPNPWGPEARWNKRRRKG